MFKLLKYIFSLIEKISPFSSSLIAGWYSTINGWRFDDVKKHIDQSLINSNDSSKSFLSLLTSKGLIENSPKSAGHRLAFVSPLPPQDTGISNCTFNTFINSEIPIDLFSPTVSDDFFLYNSNLFSSNGCTRLIDSKLIIYANSIIDYNNIILCIGNSNHNIYILDIINKLKITGAINKAVAYIHDPYIHNFLQKGLNLNANDYYKLIKKIYPENLFGAHNLAYVPSTEWQLHEYLLSRKITGIRVLHSFGIECFLTNSAYASKLIGYDLSELEYELNSIFHPIFKPFSTNHTSIHKNITKEKSKIYIGSFGIPSLSKKIDLLIEALDILNASNNTYNLLLAGFNVNEFFIKHPNLERDYILKFENLDDSSLFELMSISDIAVQLRNKDTGESSGIIPQLLLNNIKTLATPTGAFLEYPESLNYFNGNNAKELAIAIEESLNQVIDIEEIQKYCDERSPQMFINKLSCIYN